MPLRLCARLCQTITIWGDGSVARNFHVEFTPGRRLDVPVNCLDIRRAKDELNWQPGVSLEDGISRTWEWLKAGGF